MMGYPAGWTNQHHHHMGHQLQHSRCVSKGSPYTSKTRTHIQRHMYTTQMHKLCKPERPFLHKQLPTGPLKLTLAAASPPGTIKAITQQTVRAHIRSSFASDRVRLRFFVFAAMATLSTQV